MINACSYLDVDSFLNTLKININGLSILNFNIRSYFRNFDKFYQLINKNENKFDVIILSETWAREGTVKLCCIPYHSY